MRLCAIKRLALNQTTAGRRRHKHTHTHTKYSHSQAVILFGHHHHHRHLCEWTNERTQKTEYSIIDSVKQTMFDSVLREKSNRISVSHSHNTGCRTVQCSLLTGPRGGKEKRETHLSWQQNDWIECVRVNVRWNCFISRRSWSQDRARARALQRTHLSEDCAFALAPTKSERKISK